MNIDNNNGDNIGKWKLSVLSEHALLLSYPTNNLHLYEIIKETLTIIENTNLPHFVEAVPAYNSIAIFFDKLITKEFVNTFVQLLEDGSKQKSNKSEITTNKKAPKHIRVPICYEMGLDWEYVEAQTQMNKKEIIERHSQTIYQVAMLGFLPGFVYLSGMDTALACPRKQNPRIQVPVGSVGIGGQQTGIYSLACPGGWQIIGQTPLPFFDPTHLPPCPVQMGDRIQFYSISKSQFIEIKKG